METKIADQEPKIIAWDEIQEFMEKNPAESVDGIVLGWWHGWRDHDEDGNVMANPDDPLFVPFDKQNVILTLDEAKPFMQQWGWYNMSWGTTDCYWSTVWTTNFILTMHHYDGQTCLSYAPRNPAIMEGK